MGYMDGGLKEGKVHLTEHVPWRLRLAPVIGTLTFRLETPVLGSWWPVHQALPQLLGHLPNTRHHGRGPNQGPWDHLWFLDDS